MSDVDKTRKGDMTETGRLKATGIGLSAVLMWATLGLFGAGSGNVPPFLLNTLCFGFSGLLALAWLLVTGKTRLLRQPIGVWAFGTFGLFGFHFFYFTAIRNAPPVEANLINYTWPLLIVLFSALLPGEKLRLHHILGTVLGLAGAVLLITGGEGVEFAGGSMLGYGAAVASCLFWSSYSVLSRRLGAVPTEAVAGFCLMTALLSGVCHLLLEETVWPAAPAMGLCPGPGGLSGWACLLHLGHRRQARGYPGPGRGRLFRTAAVHAASDRVRLRCPDPFRRHCVSCNHARRRDRCQGHDLQISGETGQELM